MKTHRSIKYLLTSFILLISVAILTPNLAEATYNTGNPVTDQFLDLAQAKLDGEYRVLLSGNADDAKDSKVIIIGKAADKEKNILDTKVKINKGMSDSNLKYTKFSSKLKIQSADVKDNEANLKVIEDVELNVENGKKESTVSKSENIHNFDFIKQNGIWVIVDDREDGEQRESNNRDPKYKINDSSLKIQGNPSDKSKKISLGEKSFLSLLDFIAPAFAYSGTYSPANAVNYART